MHSKHQGHGSRRDAGVAIAAMQYAAPQTMLEAFFTDAATPKENGSRAKKSIIVQRLHHQYVGFFARRINRGRNHQKGVVDVDKIGFFPMEESGDFPPSVLRPRHPAY
jgi:hypothetical protein